MSGVWIPDDSKAIFAGMHGIPLFLSIRFVVSLLKIAYFSFYAKISLSIMELVENKFFDSNDPMQMTEILEQFPVGIILLDDEFRIHFINQNAKGFGLNGLPGDENVTEKKSLSGMFDDAEMQLLKDGGVIEKELRRVKTISGGEITVIQKAVPLFNEEQFRGAIVIVEDLKLPAEVTQQKQEYVDNFFSSILDSIWSLFLLITPDGKIHLTGGKKVKLFTSAKGTYSDTIAEFFKPEISEKILPTYRASLLKRQSEEFILDIPNPENDGDKEYFECMISPHYFDSQKAQFVFISIREITTFLKMIENYQRENSELQQYQKYAQASPQAVFAIDKKEKIIFWNKSAEELYKLRRSEVFGKQITKIFKDFSHEQIEQWSNPVDEKEPTIFEKQIVRVDSQKKYIHFKVSRIELEPDEPAFVFTGVDFSREKENEIQLEKRIFLHEIMFSNSAFPTFILNNDGGFVSANASFLNEFNYKHEEIDKLFLIDLIEPGFIVEKDVTFRSLTSREVELLEIPVVSKSGQRRVYSLSLIPIEHKEKGSKEWGGILVNITRNKAIENEFLILRSVFNSSNDGIAVESDGKYILVNDAFAKLYGYNSANEIIGEESWGITSEEEAGKGADLSKQHQGKKDTPTRYEFLTKRKDGSQFYAEVSVTFFEFGDRKYFVIITRDVTERKRTQQVIKESEERYRNIAENIDDFFWTAERVNDKLKPIFYTSSVEKITGYTQLEFLEDKKQFFRLIYPDDTRQVIDKLKRFYQNVYKRSEEIEFRIINKFGNIVWVRNKINVLRDRKGRITKIYGLVSDVSFQKKAEEELRLSTDNLQKLNETKDKFISIISHDLRTPFSSILGFTDLLLNEDDLTAEESRQYIQYIQESSHNMLALVNSLLDWTRIQTGRIQFEPVHIDLNELVQKIITGLTGVALKKDIQLINNVPLDFMLFIDQSLTMQVFNNLLSNALKFTNSGGSIFVEAKQAEQPRYVQITVRDTGQGIKPENVSKIFSIESKFTTEGTAGEKGTGLGLSLVKEIVEKHGGKIWIESEYGKGTEFIFTLPKASATILYIDDSNTDRILYTKILRSIVADYEIISAQNGKDGLEKLMSKSPALIITDHAMPVMNGMEFVQEYNKIKMKGKPPVIILSGDIGRSEQLAYAELGVEYVFQKPVNIVTFKDAVEKSLKKLPH